MLFSFLCVSAPTVPCPVWTAARVARLTQRRDLLRRVAEEYRVRYESGQVSFADVRDAAIAALRADLDLPHSPTKRVALREEWLALTQEAERVTEELFQTGQTTQVQIYEAQIARLEAQIGLEREKQSAPSSTYPAF